MKKTIEYAADCIFCGSRPKYLHYDDNMYYVYCPNKNCNKHDKYAYLGYNLDSSIEQWNYMNRQLTTRRRNK